MTDTPSTISLTQEQLDNIVAGAGQKAIEAYIASQEKDKPEKEKPETIVNEAKSKLNQEQQAAADRADIESAIKFNMNIDKFVTDNQALLPAEAKKILETVNGKSYSSEKSKADELRKSLIDSFIQVQANIDALPQSQKDQVNIYKALTEDEKVRQSTKFWGVVDVGISQKMLTKKANELAKAGNGGGDSGAFEQRFLELGNRFLKKEK